MRGGGGSKHSAVGVRRRSGGRRRARAAYRAASGHLGCGDASRAQQRVDPLLPHGAPPTHCALHRRQCGRPGADGHVLGATSQAGPSARLRPGCARIRGVGSHGQRSLVNHGLDDERVVVPANQRPPPSVPRASSREATCVADKGEKDGGGWRGRCVGVSGRAGAPDLVGLQLPENPSSPKATHLGVEPQRGDVTQQRLRRGGGHLATVEIELPRHLRGV